MVTKNLPKYATERLEDYIISVTDASKSQAGISLVTSDASIYCFDDVCKLFYTEHNSATSADGLLFPKGNIELVEFKSGFSRRITKDKFDPSKGACTTLKEKYGVEHICDYYWDLFWKLADKERSELIDSIRSKAIESYILLEKHIFPVCEDIENGRNVQLILTVVVDEDGVDGIEDTLAELAEETEPRADNSLSSIRQALKRLINRHDAKGTPYFYDRIEVLSAKDFKNRISCT